MVCVNESMKEHPRKTVTRLIITGIDSQGRIITEKSVSHLIECSDIMNLMQLDFYSMSSLPLLCAILHQNRL